jgi:anti-anti-sigma regulatory factor
MTSTSEAPPARAVPSPDPDRPPAARTGSLSLTLQCTRGTTVLTMVGRFDTTGLRAVEGLIDHIGCTVTDHLLVEASALEHVDEPGVRMLVALDCYMRARGGRLTVVDAGDQVRVALHGTGLAVRATATGADGPSCRQASPAAI